MHGLIFAKLNKVEHKDACKKWTSCLLLQATCCVQHFLIVYTRATVLNITACVELGVQQFALNKQKFAVYACNSMHLYEYNSYVHKTEYTLISNLSPVLHVRNPKRHLHCL